MMFLALFIPFLAGYGFVFHQTRSIKLSVIERLALAFLAGQVFLTLLLFLTTMILGKIHPILINTLLLFSTTGFLIAGYRKRMDRQRSNLFSQTQLFNSKLIQLTLVTFVGFLLFLVILTTLSSPIIAYDGFAIYAPKSFAMYSDRQISNAFLLRDLPHPDYPLLIPISEAWTAIMMNHWDERAIKVIFPLFLTAMILLVAGFISRRFGTITGLAGAFLLLSTPKIFESGSVALCDFPVGVFILAGVIVLLECSSCSKSHSLLLPAVLLAGASWTKNEGLPLALIVLGVFSTWHLGKTSWKSKLLPRKEDGYRLIAFIICVLPWWLVKYSLGLQNEMINAKTLNPQWWLEHLHRIPLLIRYFSSEMIYSGWQGCAWGQWLAGWMMFGVALLLCVLLQRRHETGKLAAVAVLQLLLFLIIFVITPYELSYQLRTALDRMLLQIFPSAMLFTMVVFCQTLSDNSQGTNQV